jgi:chromate transporter
MHEVTMSKESMFRLREVLFEWGRIGCIGFGGPPAHISLLRELCVTKKKWMTDEYFEDAIATCNLLPGPASTQLSILCAWTVAGLPGAIIGGLAFIIPGLVAIVALSMVFLASAPPQWVVAVGAGASSALVAVALHAGFSLIPNSWQRTRSRIRWLCYVIVGGLASVFAGSGVVFLLLGCGLFEMLYRRGVPPRFSASLTHLAVVYATFESGLFRRGIDQSLLWTAFKVGALSYGGGFVIIPMMFNDAVHRFYWMSESQFLDAVVLGQITPGPVVHTVAVVGFAAGGVMGALATACVAFVPSFILVGGGARHFEKLRNNASVRSFLDGAGPGALGAILGVSVPLLMSLSQPWQLVVAAGAVFCVFVLRRSPFQVLLLAAIIGGLAVQLGATLPAS